MSFRVHFQDVPHSEQVRDECEKLSGSLQDEFPETEKFEITFSRTGEEYAAHLHVTGRNLSVNSTSEARELNDTLAEAFERAHKQLRKRHDKEIFTRRREAQKGTRR